MMSTVEFIKNYWLHYLLLEKDFLATQRYLEIDEFNGRAYSNEYLKQYQSICSEIDVFCKEFCGILNSNSKADNIHKYCKSIIDYDCSFSDKKIYVKFWRKEIQPWLNWTYKINIDKNGIRKISSNPPKWWTIYNKVKHQRTTMLRSYSNIPFYKLANQENIVNALGALFMLETTCFAYLACQEKKKLSIPLPMSQLFESEKVEDVTILGDNIAMVYDSGALNFVTVNE